MIPSVVVKNMRDNLRVLLGPAFKHQMKKAFLITPFSAERAGDEDPEIFRAVQHAVEEAVRQSDVQLVHPQRMSQAGEIMEQVREELENADLVLAILTGHNPNVFYELGLSKRQAILICSSADDVPFDVKGLRYWTYGGDGELQTLSARLADAIRKTLQGPRVEQYVHRRNPLSQFTPFPTPAGFVGRTVRGPLAPQFVTCWSEYQRIYGPETEPSVSYMGYAVRGFFENGGKQACIARVCSAGATTAMAVVPTLDSAQALNIEASTPGQWGNRIVVSIQEATRSGMRLGIYCMDNEDNIDAIDYDNLSIDAQGKNCILDVINSTQERLIDIHWADSSIGPSTPVLGNTLLEGGSDGDVSGVEGFIQALDSIERVGLVCIPDAASPSLSPGHRSALIDALIDHCERKQDCFAIVSTEPHNTEVPVPIDSCFAAMYFPWIRVKGRRTSEAFLVPPVGHVAGIYARSDAEQGVYKAPMDQILRGIDLETATKMDSLEFEITDAQQEMLFRKGINSIRDFRTSRDEIRVTTATTMAVDYIWKYVNTRRFLMFISNTLDELTMWVTFERNEESLWKRLRVEINAFMKNLWQEGALWGQTADEAFFVRCDNRTMTTNDIENGRLICEVGFVTVAPPEIFMIHLKRQCDLGDTDIYSSETFPAIDILDTNGRIVESRPVQNVLGIRLVDNFTNGQPIGSVHTYLDVWDRSNNRSLANIEGRISDSGIVIYRGLEQRAGPLELGTLEYRIRIESDYYRPEYEQIDDRPEISSLLHGNNNQLPINSRYCQDVVLFPATNYPFSTDIHVVSGVVLDEDNQPVSNALVFSGERERVLSDFRGEFRLPLGGSQDNLAWTIQAVQNSRFLRGEVSISVPVGQKYKQSIVIYMS